MKNLIYVCLVSLMFACGSSNPSPTSAVNSLSFKANGVQKSFAAGVNTYAIVLNINGQIAQMTISGGTAITSSSQDYDSFSFSATNTPSTPFTTVVSTFDKGFFTYTEKRQNNINAWAPCPASQNKGFKVIVSEYDASAKKMKGTFTGTICGTNGVGDMVISEGVFDLPVR